MCFKGEALRAFDIFGAPIGLNYKGQNKFSTKVGGLCTLLLYTLLASLAVDDLVGLFSNKPPQQVVASSFAAYTNESATTWDLDTANFTHAGMLNYAENIVDPGYDVQQIARVQFYAEYLVLNQTTSMYDMKYHWYDSVQCKDMYADAMVNDQVMATEFGYSDTQTWWCPDTESFSLLNDPTLYRYGPGTNLIMVVNECGIAKQVAEENNLTDFDCPLDVEETKSLILKLTVWDKSMTMDAQDFNFYRKNGYMQTYFTNRQKTGLESQIQGSHSVATRVSVNFNDNAPWYTYIPILGWFTFIEQDT